MPTRGRFVCHVHSLVHDVAVRSSPCGPHHENFGRNLYHMFVPAYSASQYFVFLCCGIRVASKSYVDSISFSSGFSTYGSAMIYYGIHSFILVRMFIVNTICCNFDTLIQLEYMSFKILTNVNLFRMAPLTRKNPDRNDGDQSNRHHHLHLRRHGKL